MEAPHVYGVWQLLLGRLKQRGARLHGQLSLLGGGLMIPPRWLQRSQIPYTVTRGMSQGTACQVGLVSHFLPQPYKLCTVVSSTFSWPQAQSLAHIQGEIKWTLSLYERCVKEFVECFQAVSIAKIKFIYSYPKMGTRTRNIFQSF